jgi:hypothetical protein
MARRPRHEFAVLALCVCCACSLVYPLNPQDVSRLGVTDGIASYGTVRIDRFASETSDKAHYGGHWYSDKPPGMAVLALPTYAALRAAGAVHPAAGPWQRAWTLWLLRLLTGGIGFAALLLLIGRAAEALAPGAGALAAVAAGIGTFALGLAATSFAHLDAGALAFAAYLLVTGSRDSDDRAVRRRLVLAGLAVGCGVLFDYLVGIVAVALLAYLAATSRSWRRVVLFCCGGLPAIVALAVYDQAAFGSPFHIAYDYGTGYNGAEHQHGLSGAGLPKLGYVRTIMIGGHGLLHTSPVIVAAACGLVLLWRRWRAETATCAAIVVAFFVYSSGFFDPIGGRSPGPRYLAAAIPYAAIGLVPIARRWPWPTLALTAISAALAIVDGVHWAWVTPTSTWLFVDMRPAYAALLLALPACGALALAARALLSAGPASSHRSPPCTSRRTEQAAS